MTITKRMTPMLNPRARRDEGLALGKDAYLIFELDGSEYAMPVVHVAEIITALEYSQVPGAPKYLLGVCNLRGKILPIVDLRCRFAMPAYDSRGRDCYLIIRHEIDETSYQVVIQVDQVKEVTRTDSDSIDPAPNVNDFINRPVFCGVAKTESGVKLIVDVPAFVIQLRDAIRHAYNRGSD